MVPKPAESSASLLRKAQTEARNVHWEAALLMHMRAEKFHPPQLQYKFHPARKWAFDFAWPEVMLAAEVDGGAKGVSCGSCGGRGLIFRGAASVIRGMGMVRYQESCRSCRGGGKVAGGHTSGQGFEDDHEKINEATRRFQPQLIVTSEIEQS